MLSGNAALRSNQPSLADQRFCWDSVATKGEEAPMTLGYGLLGLIIAVAGYLIYIYNSLVSNKNLVAEGWSGIDVQLKRRADLIPNLVETVKGYASHEDKLFRDIAELRAKSIAGGSVADKSAVGQAMSAALGRLFAIAEAYPELKADANFRDLQEKLAGVEDEIQLSRRYYNGAVRNFNTLIESFPSNVVANFFRFIKAEFFEIGDAAQREVPKVDFKKA
jgi:LemA protein